MEKECSATSCIDRKDSAKKKTYINKREVRNKDVLTVAVRDANRFTVLGEARPSYLQ